MPPAPVASSVASPVTVVAVGVARIVAVTVSVIGITLAVVVVGVVSITRIRENGLHSLTRQKVSPSKGQDLDRRDTFRRANGSWFFGFN